MSRVRDAVVVGGGPAGLALAAAAAARGLDVVVLERRQGTLDKACGEGILPAGRRALAALGVLPHLDPGETAPLHELRWCEEGRAAAVVRLPGGGGLGVRRTALSAALRARAGELGAEIRTGTEVVGHRREAGRVVALLPGGEAVAGRLLVAADGLGSPIREREGLGLPARAPARFGIRRHFAVPPWGAAVEVHFGEGVEAYLTPVGPAQVGLAFLFERGVLRRAWADWLGSAGGPAEGDRASPSLHRELLTRFPALEARLSGAAPRSAVRGAGPLERRSRARVADRLVLLGDAAGYLDPITGEGLSLALNAAVDLAALLPAALARGATAGALAPYDAAWRRRYRAYLAWTRLMLLLSRRPHLRRAVLRLAAAQRPAFERVVAAAVG